MEMPISNVVKVTEECKVIPAPNPTSEKVFSSSDEGNNYLPLTFFDTIWLKFPPTEQILLYEIHNLSSEHFYNTILPKLKHSLSVTLQHYPSLAGTLTWHPDTAKPIIRYCAADDGDGVPFSVAESCILDFDSVSSDHLKEAKDLHHLLPEFHVSESSKVKVVSLRVTLFPNYGFSIGYCAHHTCMDGRSMSMFLNSWATICRVGGASPLTPELMPILDRSLIHDPSDIGTLFTNQWMKRIHGTETEKSLVPMDMKPEPGLFRSTFRLTPEQIGQIKEKIAIIIKSPVSTFTAVCSYVWTCLVKAEEAEEKEKEGDITKEIIYLNINVDCRGGGRWKPPVPANYFGNCVTYRFAKAKVESLKGGDGLVVAAAAIKEAIESLDDGGIDKGVENWLLEVSSTFRNEKVYAIGGSPWFHFYGVDFGWGRPEKVEIVSSDRTGSFTLCDCRDGNGVIEIGIVLTKPKIEAFASIFAQGLLQGLIAS